jgi:uncharacterized damage-inducible protein DinB
MESTDHLIAELDREAETTARVLRIVPKEQLAWRPHEKSMSLGQLAHHIATCTGQIAGLLSKDTFEFTSGPQPMGEARPDDDLVAVMSENVAKAKEYLAGLDEASLAAPWKVTRGGKAIFEMPRHVAIRAIMLSHWYHHRGQMTVYLRLLNVPLPAIYGNSADEKPFA